MGRHITGSSIYSTGGIFCFHTGVTLFLPPFFITCSCVAKEGSQVVYTTPKLFIRLIQKLCITTELVMQSGNNGTQRTSFGKFPSCVFE